MENIEINNNDIAAIIGKAVGEAVAPLYSQIKDLQEAIKPQQEENKEPEFPHDVWERAMRQAKAEGRF